MKHLLYGLLAVVAMLVLLVAVVLVPPHLQIRGINVELPSLDRIADIQTDAGNLPVDVSFVTTSTQSGIGHVGVLVTWSGGRQFLIDAGMDRAAAAEFGKPMETLFDADPAENFGPIEEQIGNAVNDIEGIGFTHLHIDHTQGVTGLCAAMQEPATIFQTPLQAGEQNLHTEEGQSLIVASACSSQILPDDQIIPIEGFPGVYAIPAAGHTPGSTIFVVVTATQTWLFSGDITNDMQSIRLNQDKGILYSYFIVPENTALLDQWRPWLNEADSRDGITVLPAHDINHMDEKLN